ncbi:MAG: 2'-5' RNA ligase family protein [Actinomycetota bacterium]|nr:MAG: 2'-5' RNA ligase family protein [Actinomycetota bacterium]
MPRCTLGVAIAVPEPYAGELEAWRERFGDRLAHSIPAHITLLPPLTAIPARVPAIEAHLAAVAAAAAPFDIQLAGTATFRPVSPVVFVRLVEGAEGCEKLESAVRDGPLRRTLEFPYHPHVTVAHDVGEATLDDAEVALRGYAARFTVEGFSLYEHGSDGVWRPRRGFVFGLPANALPAC